jgi:hypothetical protein
MIDVAKEDKQLSHTCSEKGYNEQIANQRKLYPTITASSFSLDDTTSFAQWLADFSRYILTYHHLEYCDIVYYIFSLKSDEKIGQILTNLECVFSSCEKDEQKKEVYTFLRKFYDRVSLAQLEYTSYVRNDDDIGRICDIKITEFNKKIQSTIQEKEEEITRQLISLVAIFTALSFVVFGGISILDNLLSNIKTAPILKILFVGDLWMICMCNLFFIFVKLISAIIGKVLEKLAIYWKGINAVLLVVFCILLSILYHLYQQFFF